MMHFEKNNSVIDSITDMYDNLFFIFSYPYPFFLFFLVSSQSLLLPIRGNEYQKIVCGLPRSDFHGSFRTTRS